MWCIYLLSTVRSIKKETNKKLEDKVHFKSLIDCEIEFKHKWGKSCKETTLRKRIFNLEYKQGLFFEKTKELDKFKASNTRKMSEKYPKLKVVMNDCSNTFGWLLLDFFQWTKLKRGSSSGDFLQVLPFYYGKPLDNCFWILL